MKKKKPTLSEALKKASNNKEEKEMVTETKQKTPPSRKGTKVIAGHFDTAVSKQLKMIALEEDTSVQELLREALNDLFGKRGKAPIA